MKESIGGLKLACIYSWNCEAAKELKASEILYNFAALEEPTQKSINLVKEILKVLKPYKDYCLIADGLRIKNIFDYRVVAPYWHYFDQTKPLIWHNQAILSRLKNTLTKLIDAHQKLSETFVLSGEIKEEMTDLWLVKYKPIIRLKNRFALGTYQIKGVMKAFTPDAKIGDFITFHFSAGAEIIGREDAKKITDAAKETLKLFNAKMV